MMMIGANDRIHESSRLEPFRLSFESSYSVGSTDCEAEREPVPRDGLALCWLFSPSLRASQRRLRGVIAERLQGVKRLERLRDRRD